MEYLRCSVAVVSQTESSMTSFKYCLCCVTVSGWRWRYVWGLVHCLFPRSPLRLTHGGPRFLTATFCGSSSSISSSSSSLSSFSSSSSRVRPFRFFVLTVLSPAAPGRPWLSLSARFSHCSLCSALLTGDRRKNKAKLDTHIVNSLASLSQMCTSSEPPRCIHPSAAGR